MTAVVLRALWSQLLPGTTLHPEDIEAIEGMAGVPLRAAHRPHEITLGHRFLHSSDRGDTVIRVRREPDAGAVVLDLVSSDPAQTREDWQPEIDALDAAVHTVQRLRQLREATPRPLAFIASPITPAGDLATFTKLVRMVKALNAAGIDTAEPDDLAPRALPVGSLAHSVSLREYPLRPPDVDLIVVVDEIGGIGSALSDFLAQVRAKVILAVQEDTIVPVDALRRARGPQQDLTFWIESALPDLTQRARTRQSLSYRLLRQLPRARARLTTIDDAMVERSGLNRETALQLLASPEAYASATVSDTFALHLALGTEFVPLLQFRPPARLVTPVGLVPDQDWVATVAGPFLSQQETSSLAVAAATAQASVEQLIRAVEAYVDTVTDPDVHHRRGMVTVDDWAALIRVHPRDAGTE